MPYALIGQIVRARLQEVAATTPAPHGFADNARLCSTDATPP
jgi:hypothetical protein